METLPLILFGAIALIIIVATMLVHFAIDANFKDKRYSVKRYQKNSKKIEFEVHP